MGTPSSVFSQHTVLPPKGKKASGEGCHWGLICWDHVGVTVSPHLVSHMGAMRPKLLWAPGTLLDWCQREDRTELQQLSSPDHMRLCTPTMQTHKQPSHSCRSLQLPQASALKHETLQGACLDALLLSCLPLPDANWFPTFPSMCSSVWHHHSYLNWGDSVVYFKNTRQWWICIS